MAFEGLSERLQKAFSGLRRKGKVSESDVRDAMREIRLALLEADVNFDVVKTFIKNVRTKAVGSEVLESLTPAQQIIKIVNDELVKTMGEAAVPLNKAPHIPTVIMMAGLQGAGKTTTVGKLSKYLKRRGRYSSRLMSTGLPPLISCKPLVNNSMFRFLKWARTRIPLKLCVKGWPLPKKTKTIMF